jgi:DUF1680 family protein
LRSHRQHDVELAHAGRDRRRKVHHRCNRTRTLQRDQFRNVAGRHSLLLSQPSGVRSIHERKDSWYDTTCCPPNLERTFASLPGYFYSTTNDGIYLHHLYDNSELNWHLENGVGLKVVQKTNYPWDGMIEVSVTPAEPSKFTFYLRIPRWADDGQVSVNGKAVTGAKPGEYLAISRQWAQGDVIHLQLEMPVQVLQANPQVADDAGRVAVQRGPLVYCLEELDQPAGVAMSDLAVALGQKPQAPISK